MHEAKGEFIIIHSEYVDIITASQAIAVELW